MNRLTRSQKIVVGVFLLIALGLRVQASLSDRSLPEGDAAHYDQLAHSLATGKGYRTATGELTAYRPPFYPVFLAAIYRFLGRDYQAVRFIQAILSTLTVLFISLWALVLFGGWSACFAALIAAVYPPFYVFYFGCASLVSETLYTFLLTSALFTLFVYLSSPSWPLAVLSGLSWSFGILTRGVPLPLLFVLPLFLILLKYPLYKILHYHLMVGWVAASVLTPWIVRNYLVFKAFVPVATYGGETFYISNHEGSDGLGGEFLRNVIFPENERLKSLGFSEADKSKYFFKKGMDFIRSHPQEAFQLFLRKIYLYMDLTNTSYKGATPKRTLNGGYIFVLLGAFIGFLLAREDRNFFQPVLLLTLIFGYFLLFHAFFHTAHRFRFPTEPILIVITSFALDSVRKRFKIV